MEVLVVSRDKTRRLEYLPALRSGVTVHECADYEDAVRIHHANRFQAVVIAVGPDDDAASLSLLERLTEQSRERNEAASQIFLAVERSSEELAIAALRRGARNYFKIPFEIQEFVHAVRASLSSSRPAPAVSPVGVSKLVGVSHEIGALREYVIKVAQSACNVLITGETGTGKEMIAELVHHESRRCSKPFVCINCAAVPDLLLESELFGHERGAFTGAVAGRDGKLRQADGGTVFFDEIGDMTLNAQAKILRAIESREVQRLGSQRTTHVDLRIVAATNQPLESLSDQNLFRKDLFYRLNVARIRLSPLRERSEDIPVLLDHFLEVFGRKSTHRLRGFTAEAMRVLSAYSWPGNVRELRNVVEAVYIQSGRNIVDVSDLPAALLDTHAAPVSQDDRERLVDALRVTAWNKSKAAQKLNWSRMTVYRKMAQYGIADQPRLPVDSEVQSKAKMLRAASAG